MSEKIDQLLADSRLAFLNQQNGKALNLAEQSVALWPSGPGMRLPHLRFPQAYRHSLPSTLRI